MIHSYADQSSNLGFGGRVNLFGHMPSSPVMCCFLPVVMEGVDLFYAVYQATCGLSGFFLDASWLLTDVKLRADMVISIFSPDFLAGGVGPGFLAVNRSLFLFHQAA